MGETFHSGFVSIVGRPNVGKSTLLNRLAGEKIAIVSNKPQTTRNKIQAIISEPGFQIVFIDTPGIHKPKSKLDQAMNTAAESSVKGVDLILLVINPRVTDADRAVIDKFKGVKASVFLVINKTDTADKGGLLPVIDEFGGLFEAVMPISALTGDNLDALMNEIRRKMPEGPEYFPSDMITDQPERQIVSELVREKALRLLDEEIPHGIAVDIVSMKKNGAIIDIDATIYCERDSHKAIIIGKGGAMLKNIGIKSREDIESLLGSKVNLQLWVKAKKNWRDSDFFIKNFGYR